LPQLSELERAFQLVADGSFKDQHGTAAWVIEAESNTNRSTGVNLTPGALSDQSAYRSEVSGLFGIAFMIRELCKFHHILAGGTVQINCDGLVIPDSVRPPTVRPPILNGSHKACPQPMSLHLCYRLRPMQ
jgi:hypothetical protein